MEAGQQGQHTYHIPPPYVTHAEMAPVHTRIGRLERGQEAVLETYGHLRGEILGRFDRLEAQRNADAAPLPNAGGLNLSVRESVILAVALVLAGAVLDNVLGKPPLPTAKAVEILAQ